MNVHADEPTHAPTARARVRVFIATRVDGFIARADGSIDWLARADAGAAPGEDFGYPAFFGSVDALVMRRRT